MGKTGVSVNFPSLSTIDAQALPWWGLCKSGMAQSEIPSVVPRTPPCQTNQLRNRSVLGKHHFARNEHPFPKTERP